MYLQPPQGYCNASGEQFARRGLFLILVQRDPYEGTQGKLDPPCRPWPIRAIVRKVALHQCGHFMMGSARAFGERIPISGAYGSDGLPRTVSQRVYERAVPVPAELIEAWNKGGGWNSSGSEGPSMREWALANLDKLTGKVVIP